MIFHKLKINRCPAATENWELFTHLRGYGGKVGADVFDR